MATGKSPDPKRQKTQHPHASYLGIKPGSKDAGYKAGEMFGCYGHRSGTHKPCVEIMTDAQLQCPYCMNGHDPVWRGYVPIWDRDFTLRYVLVNQEYFLSTDMIPTGACVLILRGKDPKSPLVVREEQVLTRALPDREPWSIPVNQLNVCLTLWQNPALTNWYRINKPQELIVPKPVAKAEGKSKSSKNPLERLAAAEAAARMEAAAEEMKIGRVIEDVMRPAANANGAFKHPRK